MQEKHMQLESNPGAPGELKGGEIISKGSRGGGRGQSANDQRSNSMNPNSEAHQAAMDNHADQLNPNNERYQGDDDDDE